MNRRPSTVASRLLARRAAALNRHLPAARDADSHGVHQARVASRRLREAVPVLASGIKGARADGALRRIRKLTRALGSVRELDVTLEIIDELVARETLPRPALEMVRGKVVAARDERRATMLKRFETVNLGKLDQRLKAIGDLLIETRSEGWREALGARLLKRSKALATAMGAAGRMYAPEQLHQVRIAAKKLRYALELAIDAGVKGASGPVRTVKRAQETLGRLHDLQVLQFQVAEVQSEPSGSSRPDAGLEVIASALEAECRHLHAQYVAMLPRLSDVLDTTRAIVVPQVPPRARVLKMSLRTRPATRRTVRPASAPR